MQELATNNIELTDTVRSQLVQRACVESVVDGAPEFSRIVVQLPVDGRRIAIRECLLTRECECAYRRDYHDPDLSYDNPFVKDEFPRCNYFEDNGIKEKRH